MWNRKKESIVKALPKQVYIVMVIFLIITCAISFQYYIKAIMLSADNVHLDSDIVPQIHLVLIAQELDNPYWRQIEHGARVAAEQNKIILEYMGPIIANKNEQLRLLEMAVASKIDGILVQGFHDSEYVAVLNSAVQAGIPVITIDSDANESKRLAYVGTDNYAAGKMAGKEIIQLTNGYANVGIVTGLFDATNLSERVRGIKDAVKDEPNIRILDMLESKIDRVGAATAAYQLMKNYPELDLLVGTSALDGIGFAQMLNDTQHLYESLGEDVKRIHVIAFDDLQETIEYMDQGLIDSIIVQQPYQMGYSAVKLMMDHLRGNQIVTMYNTDVSVIRGAYEPLEREVINDDSH